MARIRLGPQITPPEVTLERRYGLFAMPVVFETNDPDLLEAAEQSLGRYQVPDGGQPLRLRILAVDGPQAGRDQADGAEWNVAYRTDGHYYTLSTPDSMAVADVRRGEAVAFVGRRMRREIAAVRRDLVEGLCFAMASGGRGYSPIHAAGVARGGWGVGLVGPQGAGKSTLTLAAARRGFDVFAEDSVYCHATTDGHGPGLEFWGMPWIQRLLPDALQMFPELDGVMPRLQANGETKLEIDLDEWFPGQAIPCVMPAGLVMRDRRPGPTRLVPTGPDEPAEVELLWPWGGSWTPDHQLAADRIAQLPVYRLEMGGTPDEALDALEEVFESLAAARLAG